MLRAWGASGNSFAGTTTIQAGSIWLQDDSFFSTGSVTISNNSYLILWGTFGSGVILNDFYLYSVGGYNNGQVKDSIYMDSTGAMELSGTIHLMSTADVGAYGTNVLTLSGKITGPGALWKSSQAAVDQMAWGITNNPVGKVVLSNPANDFTGGVVVYGGTLEIQAGGAAGSGDAFVRTNATLQLDANTALNSAAKLSLSGSSSVVNLAFVGTQNINQLSFDGGTTFQAAGAWGAVGSGATHTDSRFTGSGILNVAVGGTIPPPVIQSPIFDGTGTNLLLSVDTVIGHQYVLLSATNLNPPVVWMQVTTNSGTGGTLTNVVPVQKNSHNAFYRYQVD
jgi:autotransporter-associated beta strand protein